MVWVVFEGRMQSSLDSVEVRKIQWRERNEKKYIEG